MYYALAVLSNWFCPPKKNTTVPPTELKETKQPEQDTPKPPPPSPSVIHDDTFVA